MSVNCCTIHCFLGTSFCSILVKKLDYIQVPSGSRLIHCFLGTSLCSILMKKFDYTQAPS